MKHLTLEDDLAFLIFLTGTSHFCNGKFFKYCPFPYFYSDIPYYHTTLSPLSPDEVFMKEDLHSWFKGLGYEEVFGPSEVPSSEVRNRRIYTYTIMSVVIWEERK